LERKGSHTEGAALRSEWESRWVDSDTVFVLTSAGNHGEDVKEIYYYLDSTPTHSYMKYLYKYPQAEYPYEQLKEESQNRSREVNEFELMDTDVFDEDRYWDVFVEVSRLLSF